MVNNAVKYQDIFPKTKKAKKVRRVKNKLKKLSKPLQNTVSMDGLQNIKKSLNCGTKSIEENQGLERSLNEINDEVLKYQNMTLLRSRDFMSNNFCGKIRSLLENMLKYSRNTGWNCSKNGHTGPNDVSLRFIAVASRRNFKFVIQTLNIKKFIFRFRNLRKMVS